jgi:alkanesulfonate monooxygenase SsuD/methylene tetrahydromethanopterin reductase-like flavin-dependent oxidoreductase (luciferase family)
MALKDELEFGFVLPCRSWDPIDVAEMDRVAKRADALGFRDLWVTENTLDHDAYSLDAIVALTHAAALTQRIRLGVSVVVLPLHSPIHVAHQVATLDHLSGGRAVLGVGLGRTDHYAEFGVPTERRVARFNEGVALIKSLWTTGEGLGFEGFRGNFYNVSHGFKLKPVQKPHPPIWLGGGHPDSLRRATRIADGWMGAGGSSKAAFKDAVPVIKEALEAANRDPASFAISKRVFLSIHEDPAKARVEATRWFTDVYHNPKLLDTAGFAGTPTQALEYIEDLHSDGATHILLNPIHRYEEQLEAFAEVLGFV